MKSKKVGGPRNSASWNQEKKKKKIINLCTVPKKNELLMIMTSSFFRNWEKQHESSMVHIQ